MDVKLTSIGWRVGRWKYGKFHWLKGCRRKLWYYPDLICPCESSTTQKSLTHRHRRCSPPSLPQQPATATACAATCSPPPPPLPGPSKSPQHACIPGRHRLSGRLLHRWWPAPPPTPAHQHDRPASPSARRRRSTRSGARPSATGRHLHPHHTRVPGCHQLPLRPSPPPPLACSASGTCPPTHDWLASPSARCWRSTRCQWPALPPSASSIRLAVTSLPPSARRQRFLHFSLPGLCWYLTI
jgi:hypothetical protein